MPNSYTPDYDALVVGAGPNGLAAAITLRQQGLSVLILEKEQTAGGGLRSAEITLPGFTHDLCSAIHPMAVASPFFRSIPLEQYGLEWIVPPVAVAHPFEDGSAAALSGSVYHTASELGRDSNAYARLFKPLTDSWDALLPEILAPLHWPAHPFTLARFGARALLPATHLAQQFQTPSAKGLWAGIAAHAIQPLDRWASSAIGMVLTAAGHVHGWPFPKGGAQKLADALCAYFRAIGGKIQTGTYIRSLSELPAARVVLFDTSPTHLLQLAGHRFSPLYRWQLERYRYGMGVFKVDWAIEGAVPFAADVCKRAGTVHLGNTFDEIARAETQTAAGRHPEAPFVLLAQHGAFDTSRAPDGKQAVWAYCHVPHGSTLDRLDAIERQVERFAPGFRARILGRHVMNTAQMEEYNPNYIGGDINGGIADLRQLISRPVLSRSPYRSAAKGLYLCSAATPPGGGVHGMCGYHAARRALRDIFNIIIP